MHPWDREKVLWQVVVEIPGQHRMIVGPFTDEQEDDAHAVYRAWAQVATATSMKYTLEDFKISVKLQQYFPLLPSTDTDWLYSRYVKPNLPTHGT